MPERYHDWIVECPHCGNEYNVEGEDMDATIQGKTEECESCGKEYWVEGEATPHFWTLEEAPKQ